MTTKDFKKLVTDSAEPIKIWSQILFSSFTAILAFQNSKNELKWPFYALIICLSLFILIILWDNWPKKKCVSFFSPGKGHTPVEIIIEKGDVLKQEGIKVIHVPDTFETNLKKSIDKSLWRAFLEMEKNNLSNLKSIIEDSLNRFTPIPATSWTDQLQQALQNAGMKTVQYNIGTCVKYNDYLLVAFSTIIDVYGNVKEKTIDTYTNDVEKAFIGLKNANVVNAYNGTINIGLWGSVNHSNFFTPQYLIPIIVKKFIQISKNKGPICTTLRICLHDEYLNNLKSGFDFKKMQAVLDFIVKTPV